MVETPVIVTRLDNEAEDKFVTFTYHTGETTMLMDYGVIGFPPKNKSQSMPVDEAKRLMKELVSVGYRITSRENFEAPEALADTTINTSLWDWIKAIQENKYEQKSI